ncbi:diguanylate cyclase [Vibrio sp. SS-MA-C1-2]|uniref:diguanylate cyclase domain-containing protein n=1 Tax=Vibrio sp. SS-MA-C1-2 TaxID=2908646 RepID=UPI001F28A965|nr:diguanylate cyclase [Vibrio sp. SS-MA-C1-2]UJF17719.1 diguanylate cyclase [Vibrio sp. SS-MA-C1-2]
MSLKFRITLLLSTLFAFSFFNIGFIYFLETKSDQKASWVGHTYQVLTTSDKLLTSLLNLETGQRGYLLTKEKHYLKPYYKADEKTLAYVKQLTLLTKDNPAQQELALSLKIVVEKKLIDLQNTLESNIDNPQDNKISITQNGLYYMDEIRGILNNFNQNENQLLNLRLSEYRESRALLFTIIAIELIIMLGLAIFTFVLIHKSLFSPLEKLVSATDRLVKGQKQSISDYLPKDEMGYLMSHFYKMSQVVMEKQISLTQQVHTDELTGIANRVALYPDINDEIRRTHQNNYQSALCFIDLNDFKKTNDTYGHSCGDFILQETAARLNNSLRENDTIYRIGGDEFVLLIRDIHGSDDLDIIVERLTRTFKSSVSYKGQKIYIRCSLGFCIIPNDTQDSDIAIKYADIAMYKAKQQKNTDQSISYRYFSTEMLDKS